MADVKWIKITTDIFDDEKILMIESLPAADSIITIWFKMLAFCGKQNNDGVFLMNNRIAYTDEMLASIFRRDVNTVRLALETFKNYGMIEIIDNVITIPNWNKHQSLDSYEKRKERDRIYQAERRAKQRLLIKSTDSSTDLSTDTSTDVGFSDIDKEKEIDIDIELDNNTIYGGGIPEKTNQKPSKPKKIKHKYGEFNNVLLTDEERNKLFNDYGELETLKAITYLDEYIEMKGNKYKSHYLVMKKWVFDAVKKKAQKKPASQQTIEEQQQAYIDMWANA